MTTEENDKEGVEGVSKSSKGVAEKVQSRLGDKDEGGIDEEREASGSWSGGVHYRFESS
jgi:hypothetical protein